jgi:hypothetical protein
MISSFLASRGPIPSPKRGNGPDARKNRIRNRRREDIRPGQSPGPFGSFRKRVLQLRRVQAPSRPGAWTLRLFSSACPPVQTTYRLHLNFPASLYCLILILLLILLLLLVKDLPLHGTAPSRSRLCRVTEFLYTCTCTSPSTARPYLIHGIDFPFPLTLPLPPPASFKCKSEVEEEVLRSRSRKQSKGEEDPPEPNT